MNPRITSAKNKHHQSNMHIIVQNYNLKIPALVAKQSPDSYTEPLTCLINICFHDGIFPTDLKLARVVPIFKSGDSSVLSNCRPISILSFFAKVFEKLLYKYLLDFLDSNNVLYKHQFGFREKHCTQQAMCKIAYSWLKR